MSPEAYGALSLAAKHEKIAGVSLWYWRKRRYKRPGFDKHMSKAQKLRRRAEVLEARNGNVLSH
jgi:hypothetical protein